MTDYRCDKCRHWGAATAYGARGDDDGDSDVPGYAPCALTERPKFDGEPVHRRSLAIASGSEGPAVLYTAAGFSCSQFSERKT